MMRQGEYHQKSLLWSSAEKVPGEEFGEVEEKVLRTESPENNSRLGLSSVMAERNLSL